MKKQNLKKVYIILAIFIMVSGITGCGKEKTTGVEVTTESTTEAAAEDTEEAVSQNTVAADYAVTLKSSNSWENGDLKCAQFDGVIQNQTGESGRDWKVVVTVPEGAAMESGWNGEYEISGTTLTITPVDYNTEIAGNSEITFGFILDTKEAFSPEQVVLTINGTDYAMGDSGSAPTQDFAAKAEEDTQSGNDEEAAKTKDAAPADTNGTPLANHGALSVKGTDLVDKNGKIYQLKGISTHGLAWFPDYVNKDAFASLSEYGVNAMRLAMYTAEYGGYCNGGDKKKLESLVDQGVKACTDLGMYVIVDWHILSDGDPNTNKGDAKVFFETMSKKYAGNDNVIYEICNEPCNGTTWEQIKSYAEEIIPVIRANDKNAVIIVGTPNWSQDVDIASENPITGYDNIMYAVHFYASTHKGEIRSKVEKARGNGLPVIVSECSICEASGNGSVNYDEAAEWMKLINDNHMSIFAWNLSNKDEKSSLLKSSVSKTSGFSKDDFSETGAWFMEQYSK
ncbi:MAG: cellulase family glycosylhydrolase [Lachnospiraceae bacterium]|nr:cellulase family glycosylhydrolase [Lachnospiraceae bacterium]